MHRASCDTYRGIRELRVKKNALQITRNPPPSQLGFNRFASPPLQKLQFAAAKPYFTGNIQTAEAYQPFEAIRNTPAKRQQNPPRFSRAKISGNKSADRGAKHKSNAAEPAPARSPSPRFSLRAPGRPALPYYAREVLRRGKRAKYRRRGFARRQRASSAWRLGKHMRSTADSKSSQPSRISISSFV